MQQRSQRIFICSKMASDMVKDNSGSERGNPQCVHRINGKKEMFYLTTYSTHFIYGYMASDIIMVKDHSDSERGNPLPPHGLLFPINSKGSFICTISQTG